MVRLKRDRGLVRDVLRLQTELDALEAVGADLTATGDRFIEARALDPQHRGFHEQRWSTHQVLAALQTERRRNGQPPRLVVTLPVDVPIGHRTGSVVTKLLEEANGRVLVMGFVVQGRILELLTAVLGRGVQIDILLDPAKNPFLRLPPHQNLRVWRPRETGRLMHAKVLVVDPGTPNARALVGSANFSRSGLGLSGPSSDHNWEIGVLAGRTIADEIWTVFTQNLRGSDDRESPGKWIERHNVGG